MKYINHITLTSGHMRKTYPHEIDKRIYFRMNRLVKESLEGKKPEIFPGYYLRATRVENSAVATIHSQRDDIPVLTTACTDEYADLWKYMHDTATTPVTTKVSDPPPYPYIADRLELGAVLHPDALRWTGDFARCFGWFILAPHKIR